MIYISDTILKAIDDRCKGLYPCDWYSWEDWRRMIIRANPSKENIKVRNPHTLYGRSLSYQVGYKNGREAVIDWLESNSINYVGTDGITNWRALYKDLRNNI